MKNLFLSLCTLIILSACNAGMTPAPTKLSVTSNGANVFSMNVGEGYHSIRYFVTFNPVLSKLGVYNVDVSISNNQFHIKHNDCLLVNKTNCYIDIAFVPTSESAYSTNNVFTFSVENKYFESITAVSKTMGSAPESSI